MQHCNMIMNFIPLTGFSLLVPTLQIFQSINWQPTPGGAKRFSNQMMNQQVYTQITGQSQQTRLSISQDTSPPRRRAGKLSKMCRQPHRHTAIRCTRNSIPHQDGKEK